MRQVLEFSVFLTLATVSHLAFFQGDSGGGPASAGDGGNSQVTMAASSQTLAAIVKQWDTSTEILQDVTAPPEAPPLVTRAAIASRPESPRLATAPRPSMPLPELERAEKPRIDTVPPAPTSRPVATSTRPTARPEPRQAIRTPAKHDPAPAQRQVAAGAGQRGDTGQQGAAQVASRDSAKAASLLVTWGSSIRSAIERRKRYPSGTRAKGTTKLVIAMSNSGRLSSVSVQRSSGDASLDRAALAAVRNARFRPAPRGLPAGPHVFVLPITFAP